MYTSKTVLFFLAFLVVFISAHPIQHVHRRRTACSRAVAASSTVAPTAGSVPTVSVGVNVKGTDPLPVKILPGKDEDIKESSSSTVKAKPTATADEPTEPTTTKAPRPSSGNGDLSALFPVPGFSKSWSTSPLANNPLPLSDGTLRPTRLISTLSHDYVAAPDGKKAMKAHYPKGSYTFTHQPQGGLSFYAPGPSSVDLTTAKEATFGYTAGIGLYKCNINCN